MCGSVSHPGRVSALQLPAVPEAPDGACSELDRLVIAESRPGPRDFPAPPSSPLPCPPVPAFLRRALLRPALPAVRPGGHHSRLGWGARGQVAVLLVTSVDLASARLWSSSSSFITSGPVGHMQCSSLLALAGQERAPRTGALGRASGRVGAWEVVWGLSVAAGAHWSVHPGCCSRGYGRGVLRPKVWTWAPDRGLYLPPLGRASCGWGGERVSGPATERLLSLPWVFLST